MTLARITRGDPANFLFLVLFMFDFSSCCCELMASNAVLLRTFLPLCPVFRGPSALAVSDTRVCPVDLLQPHSGVGGTGKNGVLNAKTGSVCPSRELGAERCAEAWESGV